MKIGILTSSRADYGIYLPLLELLKNNSFFNLEIIAFGMHLSKSHGFSVAQIEQDQYQTLHKISSLIANDDEQAIATSYGLTILKFANFWQTNKYDLVFCLGDRFEMSAAVQAGIPFGVKYAHIHGGETTLGANDNIYRHQITHASILHFTATDLFSKKIISLMGSSANVHMVGSLSLDGIEKFKPIEKLLFYNKFKIPNQDFALVTFHPETLSPHLNIKFALEMRIALAQIVSKLLLIITMPNADTMGSVFRSEFEYLKKEYPEKVICVENFGKFNYFTAMHYAKLLIGNTSSGILEAASFGKYVINVGDRQKGRLKNANVINAVFSSDDIFEKTIDVLNMGAYQGDNIYWKEGTAQKIISIIKK